MDSHFATDHTQWTYDIGPLNRKISLLTRGRTQETGYWRGAYGEMFVAWAPLIKRDMEIEDRLAEYNFTRPISHPCFSES